MGELRIVGKKSTVLFGDDEVGEVKLFWRKDNLEEVISAEKTFNEYIEKGWLAVGECAGKKTQIFTFDVDFEKIVLAPIMMGG